MRVADGRIPGRVSGGGSYCRNSTGAGDIAVVIRNAPEQRVVIANFVIDAGGSLIVALSLSRRVDVVTRDPRQVGKRINLLQKVLRVFDDAALRQPVPRKQIAGIAAGDRGVGASGGDVID